MQEGTLNGAGKPTGVAWDASLGDGDGAPPLERDLSRTLQRASSIDGFDYFSEVSGFSGIGADSKTGVVQCVLVRSGFCGSCIALSPLTPLDSSGTPSSQHLQRYTSYFTCCK